MKSNQLLSLKKMKMAGYVMVVLFAMMLLNVRDTFGQSVSIDLKGQYTTNRCPGSMPSDNSTFTYTTSGVETPDSWFYYFGDAGTRIYLVQPNLTVKLSEWPDLK